MNLFIDTNIWLRYLLRDNETHFKLAQNILVLNEESKIKLATSTFVLSEIVYTEQSFYKINRNDVVEDIKTIKSIKNLLLVEKTNLSKTLDLFSTNKNTKWSDCIIATQIPDNYKLCSFDKGLEKLMQKGKFISPEDIATSS